MRNKRRAARGTEIRKTPSERLSNALEIPVDILGGMPHLELLGNREIVIEGCKGILEYSDDTIKLNIGKMVIKILGRELCVQTYLQESITIQGDMAVIEFSS